jgi:hypothetical protein
VLSSCNENNNLGEAYSFSPCTKSSLFSVIQGGKN